MRNQIVNIRTGKTTIIEQEGIKTTIDFVELASHVRQERNKLLSDCDWTDLPHAQLTTEQNALWGTYRQELRDITEQEGFPLNVVFPKLIEEV